MVEKMIESLKGARFGRNAFKLQDFFNEETIELIAKHLLEEGWCKDDT
jgi:hypothetical protein